MLGRLSVVVGMFVAILGSPMSALAQMTPLARLNCTASTFPACGWGPANANPYHTRQLIAGGGPSGQDVVQFTHVPTSTHAQYYFGWFGPALPNPSAGAVRYVRVKLKVVPPISLLGSGDVWGAKFIILGDGGDSSARVICSLTDNGVSSYTLAVMCSRNIDGPPNATSRVELRADGSWNSLQFEFRSSSTSSSANGQLKVWHNSNTYSSPTRQSGLFQLNTTNWGNVNVGFYAGTTVAPSGRVVFQLADVEFDDEFDSSYHSGASGSPSAPQNLRINPASPLLMGVALVGLVMLMRS